MLFGKSPRWTLIRLGIIIFSTVMLLKYFFIPIKVVGISMEPNYPNGRIYLINKWIYLHNKPKRGDVVAVNLPGRSYLYLKRIIGLPNENINIVGGTIYIGGRLLKESYIRFSSKWNLKYGIRLKSNEYFLIGDNREMAMQDHALGKVKKDHIIGKIIKF